MLLTTKLNYAVLLIVNLAKISNRTLSLNAEYPLIDLASKTRLEYIIHLLKKSKLINLINSEISLNCDLNSLTLGVIFDALKEDRDLKIEGNLNYLINNANSLNILNEKIRFHLNEISVKDILDNETNNINQHEVILCADHNATSSISSQVKAQLSNFISCGFYNPSSVHKLGQKTKKILENTRELVCTSLNAKNYEVIFTSSGTEANNLVIKGTKDYYHVASSTEHHSILKCLTEANNTIVVDKEGVICINHLDEILRSNFGKKILISVALSNNETGVIQPMQAIVSIAKKYGAIVHTDAIQACGKIILDVESLGVDIMTISAHKFGGLTGAAALIFNSKKIKINAILHGGSQERGLRAGTENITSIYSMYLALANLENRIQKMHAVEKLRNKLEDYILSLAPEALIFSKKALRIPNTSCIYMPNVGNELQVMYFDMNNIAISAGSACSSGRIETSHVLSAMGIEKKYARNSIRISLGPNSNMEEINRIFKCWRNIYGTCNN